MVKLPFMVLSAAFDGLTDLEETIASRLVVIFVGDAGGCPLMDTGLS